jgi:NADH-quinone oxidoreductase subunit L
VLAAGSVIAGALLVQVFPLSDALAPVFGRPSEHGPHVLAPATLGGIIIAVMVLGILAAWLFVGRREVPLTPPARVTPIVRAARNALYADAINESLFMRPGQWLTRALVFLDNRGVDGAVNGMAATLGGTSARLGRAQTGFVRTYAMGMLGGALIIAGAVWAVTAG